MDDMPVVAARQLLLTTADALLPRLQAAVGARCHEEERRDAWGSVNDAQLREVPGALVPRADLHRRRRLSCAKHGLHDDGAGAGKPPEMHTAMNAHTSKRAPWRGAPRASPAAPRRHTDVPHTRALCLGISYH
jgi:hypothetical protein